MSAWDIVVIIDKLKTTAKPIESDALNRIKDIVTQADSNTVYPVDMLINFLSIEAGMLTTLKDALKRSQMGRKPNTGK